MKKQILILGAGFGGIAAAKLLARYGSAFDITVVDQSPYHTIHGQLYEVATSPDELTYLPELKRSVEMPLSEIFEHSAVKVVTARVESVDLEAKKVVTAKRILSYDYLISALGAGPNFFSIPGAKEFTLPFSSSIDALRIRGAIESSIKLARSSLRHNSVDIVIAGGGVGGVEIAAELHGMLNYVCWRENYPREKVSVTVVDRTETMLSMFPPVVQRKASARLSRLSVKFQGSTTIQSISSHSLVTDKGDIGYDVLIWAAGVRANPLPSKQELPVKKGDRIEVDQYFRLKEYPNVFILGDQCCRLDSQGNPLPGTASQAIHQAQYAAQAIMALSKNQTPKAYNYKSFPYLIPLGPSWVIFSAGNYVISGYVGYLIRQFVWLRYYVSLMGLWRGGHWLLRTTELFKRND